MIEFLRPGWLAAFPAGLVLVALWWRARAGAGPWRGVVDPELLAHLAGRAPSARLAATLAVLVLALACLALAGPSWRSEPVPMYRDTTARIVVLDLSPSMQAVDVVPSRLERARAGVVSILRESAGAQLGLVVFAADAFTVAPLISDAGALVHLLASLDTRTVPRAGARPDLGLAMARALLERAGARSGDVILVGDSAGDERTLEAATALAAAGFPVSVLGVGTPHGGPVRVAGGSFARAESGEVLIIKPEFEGLERVARAGGGRFHWLGSERAPRFARGAQAWAEAPASPVRASELRKDDGAWLLLAALPLAALLFRRGWLMGLALFCALPAPEAYALDWADLWRRADQQAAAEFAKGRFGGQDEILSRLGPGSPWRAAMLYRDGRFMEAAAAFTGRDDADAHYNRGNALALAGRLEAAIAAYNAALEQSPSMRDALFNRALVREALARQRGGRGSAESQSRRELPQTPFSMRPEQLSGGTGAGRDPAQRPPRPAQGEARRPVEGPSSQREPEAGREDAARGGQPGEDLRRLEALLAQVPDDPGALLANRFRQQMRMRGSWDHDTGARW